MADFGEALSTAITSQSDAIPSLFEIFAQDNLHLSVRSAVKHVVKILAQNNPQQFSWFYGWFDEFYTILECFIQHHFLKNYQASFAEYYYDLKRVSTKPCNGSTNYLLDYRCFYSVMLLALFPYIQIKLESYYNSAKDNFVQKGVTGLSTSELIVFHCYPYIHTMWNASFLYFSFLYAIGKSNFSSPFYKILHLKLVYKDTLMSQDKEKGKVSWYFTKLLSSGVYAGVFIIQFMEWWFGEQNTSPLKQILKNPVPKPPTDDIHLTETNIPLPANGLCPLCNKNLKNETALLTSGYVFCYVCVYKYVKSHRRCPVTGYTSDTTHLVKIYPPV